MYEACCRRDAPGDAEIPRPPLSGPPSSGNGITWGVAVNLGKSVRLFLVDGTPGGLLTAEIMNWTGHVIAAPRSDLARLLGRPEAGKTGVYILLGDDPAGLGGLFAYIGEGDDVGKRLSQHARPEEAGGKDFWDLAIVVTSKDANLTKAHARYLESRFIALAQQAGRCQLDNGTAPPPLPLPEADVSDMEYFIEQARIVLPVLGVNILRSPAASPGPPADSPAYGTVSAAAAESPVFELRLRKLNITASAQEVDGEFTVLEGSAARPSWTGPDHGYKALHQRLIRDGVIITGSDPETARFARSYVFASPSAAAAVVVGRQANGREEWRLPGSGVSYGRWQARAIDQATDSASPARHHDEA